MNQSERYAQYALCREMTETVGVMKNFHVEKLSLFAETVKKADSLLLTGEGSSRIFPAKNAISKALAQGWKKGLHTEGATQAMAYDLREHCVLGASNSGKTKELIRLFHKLKEAGHGELYGLTAFENSPLEAYCRQAHVLHCGGEDAVAATKSVVEQALFFEALFQAAQGKELEGCAEAAEKVGRALALEIPGEVTEKIARAETIYFAGRNDGVAEELTLKTNEITRKKSDFLEGTYGVHGIEEVMKPQDVVILIDPFEEEEEKFQECLGDGVGAALISLSSRKTRFVHNILLPEAGAFDRYVQLAAGWNILVETGLALGIDLDNPVRARKVGNEYSPA